MKVQVWAPGFADFGGGITVFSRELAKALRDIGHEVTLVGKFDSKGTWEGMPLRGARGFPARMRTFAFALVALTACISRSPDLVVSTHLNFGPLAVLVRHFLRIRFIVVAHGIEVSAKLSESRKSALHAADAVWAVSDWTQQRLIELLGIRAGSVSILPNTIDESRFTPGEPAPALLRRYGIARDEKVLLTVARMSSDEGYKGYDRLLVALSRIRAAGRNVRFLVVGAGDERSRLESLARDVAVTDAVTFTGFVPDEELADHYRIADVFAMPSTGEGFGIVFLEALACGTPVVAGNADGSIDAVDGGRLGLAVDPGDVDAVAAAITSMLDRHGPPLWFDRQALHAAVVSTFGRRRFQSRVRDLLPG